ncbi:uncharacterized protein N7503_012011 [Penicillium pulvis]|uniref:uncharacterized protein n=1 Tax=Penicillium pulvis TaxID=1562058 RepID=UPI002546A267|nr:uncharacterized protein N7503_012011 [Penicillium pulvis]KAJ5786799.1 hypothetical protein N7503_012011 [Penicillium pulvis]
MVIISAFELNIVVMTASVPSINAIWPKHVSGLLTEQTAFAHLSSLGKTGHIGDRTKPLIIYQGSEPELDQMGIMDSSSSNNSIARTERGCCDEYPGRWLNPAQIVSPSEFCPKQ